jgi:mannosyl-oligosaccharide alpha-1,3-glucosidase
MTSHWVVFFVQDGLWEEQFGSHRDTKPNGPTSVGFDVTFHGVSNVYGIPEHASTLSLRTTDGNNGGYGEPYRLYNLDVFEYELDQPMALYGSIPFMVGHGVVGADAFTAGVFWNNPSETYVDIAREGFGPNMATKTRWISESGAWDLFLLPGPAYANVIRQYTKLTGTQALPPRFALAYHQCRWNYKDEADVLGLDAKFEEYNFPYDVIVRGIHFPASSWFVLAWGNNTVAGCVVHQCWTSSTRMASDTSLGIATCFRVYLCRSC